jgi:hypothetical protein
MLRGLLLPLVVAMAAGWLAWRHETRRLDARTFDEPRGWDTTEDEFRRRVIEERKRRRIGAMVLGALAASAMAGLLLQAVGLSDAAAG